MTRLPFAVSEFTTWHLSFEEDVALYSRLGVDAIELCERKLSPDPVLARRQIGLVEEAGLRVSSVQPLVHALYPDTLSPDPREPSERVRAYLGTLDLFSHALPDRAMTFVAIGGPAPGHDYRSAWRRAVVTYRELADRAADRGCRVAFEPLHPILMNVDTFVCTLDGAISLVEEVGSPAFGLMIDTWHVWQEPLVLDRLRSASSSIFGVQISDYPVAGPRALGDRLLPGDGAADLEGFVASTVAAGYAGDYCLEIFSDDKLEDSLWQEDPGKVIRRGRAGFERVWEAVNRGDG